MISMNVAEAKKQFSDLLGRVAYGGETVLITRRGKPMARLVPPDAATEPDHLANVSGWLDDDDPFLAEVDAIVEARSHHRPRVFGNG
ncbi:MAG: type II toxin-antitoxin system Phd/YefM family antitoxin [bacterium]|nr:type II toxin-antitoxin system Phd/YefM family antitoxin [bacterium]